MNKKTFVTKATLGYLMDRPLEEDEVRDMEISGCKVRVSSKCMEIDGQRIVMHERDGVLFPGSWAAEERLRNRLKDIDRQMEECETQEAKDALAFASRENERGHDRRLWE